MAQVANEPMDVVHLLFPSDIKRQDDESMRIISFFSFILGRDCTIAFCFEMKGWNILLAY